MALHSCVTMAVQNQPLFHHHRHQEAQTTKDPNYWNSIIKHQTKLKNDKAILTTYTQMESLNILPDNTTLPIILKACAKLNAVDRGKRIHRAILGCEDLIEDVRIRTGLVDFYCKCGFLEDARKVFDEMRERDLVLWNAMIYGYVSMGCNEEALMLFAEMEGGKLRANARTVVALLVACGEILDLRMGKEVHGYCLRNGLFDENAHVGTALIGFYLKFDEWVSRRVFESMSSRNVVSWNAMITGYNDAGDTLEALKLFTRMVVEGIEFDSVTLLVVIQACVEIESLRFGMQIHQLAIKYQFISDLFIVNALINLYSKNQNLESSYKLFESVSTRDVALWNSILSSNVKCGLLEEAISLFMRMRSECIKEDKTTITIMLSICADLPDGLRTGRSLHAHVMKSALEIDATVGNALLSMYADLNCIRSVRKTFEEMNGSDVISWNTLILALARNDLRVEAWEFFEKMNESEVRPNSHSMIAILASCGNENYIKIGKSVHCYVIRHCLDFDTSLNTALVDMYMNCGDEAKALILFEGCLEKDVISWNSLISSYVATNQAQKALLLFPLMMSEVKPNSVTIINLLSACTSLADLYQGRCLHGFALRKKPYLGFNLPLANALITMYMRCGSLQNGEKIFKSLRKRDVISWNVMIAGYGSHGETDMALDTFSQMLDDGFRPNGATFVSLLSACSHSGLVEQGLHIFESMVQDFNITPELNHYGCVVDLLGRAGSLDEANRFLNMMPVEPDASILRSLLSACRNSGDVKLAESVFQKLVEMEPMNEGNFVLLSNIYAATGHWSGVKNVRAWIREEGLAKPTGISWVTVRNQSHNFAARDKSHPESATIYALLASLLPIMKENGYVSDVYWALHYYDD